MNIRLQSLIFLLVFVFNGGETESGITNDWKLKKVTDGIEVYIRDVEASDLKELKIKTTFEKTRISQIITVLNDTKQYAEWTYKCTDAKLVERISDSESIDYYRYDFPWPMSDREIYTHSTMTQDPSTRTLKIETKAIADARFANAKDCVRVISHINTWELIPDGEDVKLIYISKSDPAGSIPDWLINMAIDHGPTKTMLGLKDILSQSAYQNAQISWIID